MDEYRALYERADADPEAFWGDLAGSELDWFEKWTRVLDWDNPPFAKWFSGGKTNVCYNCVDRHAERGGGDRPAIIWEGEPGDQRTITFAELKILVSRFANVLKTRGLTAGDRTIIYMPMVPEAAVAMLACARLGVTHSVVFGGFSAEALKARIQDLGAKLVITADGGWRRGKEVKLEDCGGRSPCRVSGRRERNRSRRTGGEVTMTPGRDHWWHELEQDAGTDCPAVPLDSEHPLYVLYTSEQPAGRKAFFTPPPDTCCSVQSR